MTSKLIKSAAVLGLLSASAVAFASAHSCCGDLAACCLELLSCCF
jgi:hypothetical protein